MASQMISAAAIDVLAHVTFSGTSAILPPTQLDRKLYEEVNEVLARLGGKWKGGKVRAHVFDFDACHLLVAVLADGRMPPKNPNAFFPTPGLVVSFMLGRAQLDPPLCGGFNKGAAAFLEPSAGRGAIAGRMREENEFAQLDCVEIDPVNCACLKIEGFSVAEIDFLEYDPEYQYDRIMMNPPFAVEGSPLAYIDHIRHAYELLKRGGRLVAIAPSSVSTRSDRKTAEFREFAERVGRILPLPADSFKESGTGVNSVMIVMDKP